MKIDDMLYVPGLTKNLLCVTQVAKRGTSVDFNSKPGRVMVSKGDMRVTSKALNGLCVFKSINKLQLAHYVHVKSMADLVRNRFGHASNSTIKDLLTQGLVRGHVVSNELDGPNEICDACQLDTKKRSNFKPSLCENVVACNSVMHSHICGLIKIASIREERLCFY